MFDFMRDRATAEDKRQEMLNAYLDNALTPTEQTRLEQQLRRDPQLRAEVEQLRALRLQLRAMPHRRVPRSFALDPVRYGRPKAQPLFPFQPVLRGATALTAFLLIFALALGAFQGQFSGVGVEAPAAAEIAATGLEQAAPAEAANESTAITAAEATERESEPAADTAMAPAVTEAPVEEAAAALAAPPPEATLLPEGEAAIPETDLAAGITAAPTGTPEVSTYAEAPAPTGEVVADVMATAAPLPVSQTPQPPGSLLPLQIGLGAAFVLFLGLWLAARRASRGR